LLLEKHIMLMIAALALATPQVCTDVAKVCRACTAKDGKTVCSDIGIACQPKLRICRPHKVPETRATPRPAR
jgi:hypothetical protein